MPCVIVRDCNAAHSGGLGGENPFFGVFDDYAIGRIGAEVGCRLEKYVRRRFHSSNVQPGDDRMKEMRDAEPGQNAEALTGARESISFRATADRARCG